MILRAFGACETLLRGANEAAATSGPFDPIRARLSGAAAARGFEEGKKT